MSASVALPMCNRFVLMMSDRQQSLPLIPPHPTSTAASSLPQQTSRPSSVRRNLFGPVDHEQNQAFVTKQLAQFLAADKEKYNFDFIEEKPIQKTSGRYQWEKLNNESVPVAYKTVCSTISNKNTPCLNTTSATSTTTCTTSSSNSSTSDVTPTMHHAEHPPVIQASTLADLPHPVAIRPNNATTTASTTTLSTNKNTTTSSTSSENITPVSTPTSSVASTSNKSNNHVKSSLCKNNNNNTKKEKAKGQSKVTEYFGMRRQRSATEETGRPNKRQRTS